MNLSYHLGWKMEDEWVERGRERGWKEDVTLMLPYGKRNLNPSQTADIAKE